MQVIFGVADLERSRQFYDRAFAWRPNPLVAGFSNYVEYLVPDGGAVGLYARDGFANEVGAEPVEIDEGRVSSSYLYVRVDDVDATVAAIQAAGGRPLSEPARGPCTRGVSRAERGERVTKKLAKLTLPFGVELRDIGSRRADAERERLPPVVEAVE